MEIRERLSPHRNARPIGTTIRAVVLHDTGSHSATSTLAWFEDPGSRVSAHYVIDRDGTTYRCVPEAERAWHAGASVLHGQGNVNDYSLGIEIVDMTDDPYPPAQVEATVELVSDLCQRYRIPLHAIVGHEHICVPLGRKSDPGPDVDWYTFLIAVAARL